MLRTKRLLLSAVVQALCECGRAQSSYDAGQALLELIQVFCNVKHIRCVKASTSTDMARLELVLRIVITKQQLRLAASIGLRASIVVSLDIER